MKLFTVGYQGLDIAEFCLNLKKKKIQCVADLRKNPISRKRGFSKRLLGEALAANGIEYIHYPGLGVPTEWRKKAKAELITRKKMFADYKKKILPVHAEEIEELRRLMKKKKTALLCYEQEASDCHRHYVSEEILAREKKGRLQVVDLEFKPQGLLSKRSRI